jgi:hypothetical protein
MRRITPKVAILAVIAMLVFAQPVEAAPTVAHRAAGAPAFFEFDVPPSPGKVIIKLTDPEKIQQARAILSGAEQESTHVMGKIVKFPVAYNQGWSYHLNPDTITFFSFAIEVCDATPQYVEDHLDEVGGAFLPGGHWCPWGSRLLREVPAA